MLQLKRSRQSKIETNGMHCDIRCHSRSEVVVRELRDDRIGVLDRVLIKEPYIPELTDLTEVDSSHHCIPEPVGSDIAGGLQVQVKGHLAVAQPDASIRDSIRQPCDLVT